MLRALQSYTEPRAVDSLLGDGRTSHTVALI